MPKLADVNSRPRLDSCWLLGSWFRSGLPGHDPLSIGELYFLVLAAAHGWGFRHDGLRVLMPMYSWCIARLLLNQVP
jgi:hypothetical protein